MSLADERIINLLVANPLTVSWRQIFTGIELLYKKSFQQKARLLFPSVLHASEAHTLQQQGYVIEGKQAYKHLTYQTALVLGGGGARGAYQIGVWQALKECAIATPIITGTSVGALNGALIMQDDFEQAKEMWEQIETKQILSFHGKEQLQHTLPELLGQIASFTGAAIQSLGVSTQPLQQLIETTFSEEKLAQAQQQVYLVTTELPGVKETVIHFNACAASQRQQWLLASASFFPAMAAAQIDRNYYVDGGYRNNIPVDVAVNNGATECIIVDVKGPGITKQLKLPEHVSCLTIRTPWPLGTVLLFDGRRSTVNIKLGYLETMKALGKYLGYWYTFDETPAAISQFQEQFFSYLQQTYQLTLWKTAKERKKLYQKVRKYYKDRVYEENISLALLELLGKTAGLPADSVYTLEAFSRMLQELWQQKQLPASETGLLSFQEWLGKYYDDFFLLSEKRQMQIITELLADASVDEQNRLAFLFEQIPVMTLQVLLKKFCIEEK